jgi:hypothetical protein
MTGLSNRAPVDEVVETDLPAAGAVSFCDRERYLG